MEPLTVSVSNAAKMIGVSEPTIWRMVGRNELASVKIGHRRLIKADSLRKLVGAE